MEGGELLTSFFTTTSHKDPTSIRMLSQNSHSHQLESMNAKNMINNAKGGNMRCDLEAFIHMKQHHLPTSSNEGTSRDRIDSHHATLEGEIKDRR